MDPSLLALVSSFLGNDETSSSNVESAETNTISEPTAQKLPGRFHVIVFTKDRPWQLLQLLLSMELRETEEMQVTIIANVRPKFKDGYRQVTRDFKDKINFLTEAKDQSFGTLLMTLIQSHGEDTNLRWMFLTDDCILLEPLLQIMKKPASSNVFLTRLHPGITWCQTRDIPSPPPRNQLRYRSNSFTYPLSSGQVDWAYSWDLSGGIYCNELVQEVFEQLDEDDTSHPNNLELAGYSILRKKSALTVSVPSSPVLLILTINRVQDVCSAPVDNIKDPAELLAFLKEGRRLDLNAYRSSHFNSSHISDLFLEENNPSSSLDLSVLMPLHKGPPHFARLAMRSVVMQVKDQSTIRTMQVVIVDDRCTDGSIDALVDGAKEAAKELDLDLVVVDHRQNERIRESTGGIVLDLYASTKPGVAAALNLGLQHARSEFIARMDADDICAPKRFVRQLDFLRRNPKLAVLGTHSMLFSASAKSDPLTVNESRVNELPFSATNVSIWKARPSLPPTDPAFAAWAMLFSCCLSHPSVMYRRRCIHNAGGYREDVAHVEDYDLWLRLTRSDPSSVASLSYIGLWHRKHRGHSDRTERQRQEAHSVAFEAIKEHVDDVGTGAARCLRQLDLGETTSDLDRAAALLLRLCESVLRTHQDQISDREIALIEHDCKERLAEIATMSITKFEDLNAGAWTLWCEKCPDKALEQVALLCHVQSKQHRITLEH